jgi:hypothetical protein
MRIERYVALGDSSTEGLDDPDGAGGYRGWADRLAEHVARIGRSMRLSERRTQPGLGKNRSG